MGNSEKSVSGAVALRYPVGFYSSQNPSSSTADLYKKFYEVVATSNYGEWAGLMDPKGVFFTISREDLFEDMESKNFMISSTLVKTQALANAMFLNIKDADPNAKVYLNPVLIDLEPEEDKENFCHSTKADFAYESSRKFSFCYSIIDASFQTDPPPAAATIDVFAANTLDLSKYWNKNHRSMGNEITPAITVSTLSPDKHLRDLNHKNFHNFYTVKDGMKNNIGDGSPFLCMMAKCKKGGKVEQKVLSVSAKTGIEGLKASTEDISIYALRTAQNFLAKSEAIEKLSAGQLDKIPALSIADGQLAKTALQVEYDYLSKNSDIVVENYLLNGWPSTTKLIAAEQKVMQELLVATKKANKNQFLGELMGAVAGGAASLNGSNSFGQAMIMQQTIVASNTAVAAELKLNAFEASNSMQPNQTATTSINLDHKSTFFSIGEVRSLSDLRQKIKKLVKGQS